MVSTSRPAATAFLVSGLFLLTSCNGDRTSEPAPSGTAAAASSLGEPRTVTENVDAPWSVAFHGGTPLVSERDSARILELDDAGQARGVAVVRGVQGDTSSHAFPHAVCSDIIAPWRLK